MLFISILTDTPPCQTPQIRKFLHHVPPPIRRDFVEDLTSAAGLEDTSVNVTSPDGQATVCGINGDEVCLEVIHVLLVLIHSQL